MLCTSKQRKAKSKINSEVNVFTFNSSQILESGKVFLCHLELLLPSQDYGFSVFIEEMSLAGSSLEESSCKEDFVQFGRDILFLTTHKSRKYCGQVETPLTKESEGMKKLEFPFTPLASRIYNEEEDQEMDIWIQVNIFNISS